MLRLSQLLIVAVPIFGQAPTPPIVAESKAAPPAAQQSILCKQLLAHAQYLSSDKLQGRLTGSPGQMMAAHYIADQFATLALEPLGDHVGGERGFLQGYGINRTSVAADSELRIGTLRITTEFAVLGARLLQARCEGNLRFSGLGRTKGSSAEVGSDESLAGVIPVVVIKPPRGKVDNPLSVEEKFGASFQSFGQVGKTTKSLEKKGAAAVLYVQVADPLGLADVLNYLAVSPGKDSLAPRFLEAESGEVATTATQPGGTEGAPSIVLSLRASAQVLNELHLTPENLKKFLSEGGEMPQGRADVAADLHVTLTHDDKAQASNVVSVLRGSDPNLAAEAVVYSAHMDHVGIRMDGEVFNGADDNASGCAALLEIAAAYAKSDQKPRRSIVFLALSGEEQGLWGSSYFTSHPTWELGKIVANINTDMIGRSGSESGPQQIVVTPSYSHDMFSTLVRDSVPLAAELGVTFTKGDSYYARSDHYSFAKLGIPVIFFCSGEHEDYHQVTDHADKLDGEKMERIARLAFWTGWNVANADEKPRVLGPRQNWR